MSTQIAPFFDSETCTMTYVVHAGPGTPCAVIDSVLDYDPKSGRTRTGSADRVVAYIETNALRVEWLLETHAHADHLSAAPYLRNRFGGRIAIGERIRVVQGVFKPIFNLEPSFRLDGSQFDHLFAADEAFRIGELEAKALAVPGHTPADMAYQVGDAVFVGDTLFMPDVGTARCDFPGGDARTLYQSIRRLLDLPSQTRLYMCHDYPPAGREAICETTVAEQRRANIHVRDGVTEDDFVQMRTRRDATLAMPTLMLPSIQVNIRAGALPPAEPNGVRYLKIPLNAL
ncbi:MBL fold metallo-hydrolase [Ralstonia solanacearum]|uniref:MBL fold metallo-hydrolase n=1 Tax=Ralstonia solanacearum TaxID=305 RepID=UPI0001817309|nr:MBL fold metallo-hydrolase [Ralstonia solanacearum]MDC6178208.1 MBL fold metallo-hydrolase [Ralstonia solanacearum]MDC6210673.1 MBL fold metallo-hydrolase [Ralstonia solanacearum]MDC6239077.1 MBL fold metallo-hydrolase [Ralstonia solanacearum]MDD7801021.1 MBL fold metallo-hydrolase [Ralstonia solanacearum]TYZ54470.1 MBL fold metallo-hydrolase [Ralstonia solanacearum]